MPSRSALLARYAEVSGRQVDDIDYYLILAKWKLACDIVLSSPAAAFGLPEVKRGLIAAGGGVITLGTRVPLGIALEMTLTGDTIDAARGWERLSELQTVVFGSEDAREGAMAFIEKRPPQWTGS